MRTACTVLALHTIVVVVTQKTLAMPDSSRSSAGLNNGTQMKQINLEIHLEETTSRFAKDLQGAMNVAPLFMLLIGLKIAGFVMTAVSFVAFLVLNAFLTSKLAVLIATALALKKWNVTFESFHGNLHVNREEVNDRW